jgi:hypothetical protein
MTALLCYNDIRCEEKIVDNNVHVKITVSNKKTEVSHVIFDKDIHILLCFPLFMFVGVPLLTILFFITIIAFPFSKKEEPEMTYQEAKKYFASGKGYFDNLSDEDKRKLFTRRKNAPLGL